GFRIMCYFSNQVKFRLFPEYIMPHQCTHIVYAVAYTKGLGLSHVEWSDLPFRKFQGMYERVVGIKNKNPDLKVLLAVASSPSSTGDPYVSIQSSQVTRQTFAQNVVVFLRRHGFDGVEISWKYPDVHSPPITNKEKFALIFK
ncbi:unnamed protein product, partial [Candidula unifasciata]